MAAKPREPTPEELAEMTELRDKLEKRNIVKKHEPQHKKDTSK